MYRAKNGEYRLLELKNRSGMQKMASVYVADLRQELKEGNRSILSRHLQELMEDRLEKQEQIMLFLNRSDTCSIMIHFSIATRVFTLS